MIVCEECDVNVKECEVNERHDEINLFLKCVEAR